MRRFVAHYDAEISGVVRLAARDLDGSVLAVNIEAHNGGSYLVDDTRKGTELLNYIGAKVHAVGRVRSEDLIQIIDISEYSIGY